MQSSTGSSPAKEGRRVLVSIKRRPEDPQLPHLVIEPPARRRRLETVDDLAAGLERTSLKPAHRIFSLSHTVDATGKRLPSAKRPRPPQADVCTAAAEMEAEEAENPVDAALPRRKERKVQYSQVGTIRRNDNQAVIQLEANKGSWGRDTEFVTDYYYMVDSGEPENNPSLLCDPTYSSRQDIERFEIGWDMQGWLEDDEASNVNDEPCDDADDDLDGKTDVDYPEEESEENEEKSEADSDREEGSKCEDDLHSPYDLDDGYAHYGDMPTAKEGSKRLGHLLAVYNDTAYDPLADYDD